MKYIVECDEPSFCFEVVATTEAGAIERAIEEAEIVVRAGEWRIVSASPESSEGT